MKRDCEHGQLARSCDVCHWQQRAERAEAALHLIAGAVPCQDYENVCNCQSWLISVAIKTLEVGDE